MRIPVIQGVIDRRILANWRIRPEVLARVVPAPFRPKLVNGWGMAGVCLIRLRELRPRHLPSFVGIGSENAAHRIAVEWELDGQIKQGVYVARRDSSSLFNTLVGGRLFPGFHHHARFDVRETKRTLRVEVNSIDGKVRLLVEADVATALTPSSVFRSLKEASSFFEAGSVGYSPSADGHDLEGLELRSFGWKVQPLAVRRAESSFFADASVFPAGSTEFDCALLMRGIEHEWHDRGLLAPLAIASPGAGADAGHEHSE
jgi:hypothetical protein